GEEAVAEALAVEHRGAERTGLSEGHVAGRALGVVGLPLEVVAALEAVPGAGADRPAELVGRMAANLGASQSASPHSEEASRHARAWGSGAEEGDRVGNIVAAADVMRRNHELGAAPGLVDPPVLHDVGEPVFGPIGVAGVDAEDQVAEVGV